MWFNLEIDVEGIFVVGVLHPGSFIGLDATSIIDGTKIVIDKPSAVDFRLSALDLAYPHLEAIKRVNLPDYAVSGTLFNRTEADLVLFESGFDRGRGFEMTVLVQKKYEGLIAYLSEVWPSTFNKFTKLSFSFDSIEGKKIPDALRSALEGPEMPSVLICDNTVFAEVRRDPDVGEPDGMVRRPYLRRV
jgi:hypothetical protein